MIIASVRPHVSIAAALFLGVGALVAACGPAQAPVAPEGNVTSADTPVPADGQCNFVNFHHDEAKNGGGAGKCSTDCDCDGMRSCVSGACQGTARPAALTAATCNSKDYRYNEAWTPAGASTCAGDCQCDGLRTCASGQCTGTAR